MSRRSAPALIGPWWTRPSFHERQLLASLRPGVEPGTWLWGTHPAWTCSRGCSLIYDPTETGACPGCLAYYGHRERERWAAIALDELLPPNSETH